MLLANNYFDIPDLYYEEYHSNIKSKDQKVIIENFKKAKYGIIACVYCLGEGWDFVLLDSVVFAENMTSNIRIIQSALRPIRKNPKNPDKIAKIILPILNTDDLFVNNPSSDLNKVTMVIYQMGLEDNTISGKIRVSRVDIQGEVSKKNLKKETTINQFGECDVDLTKKLKLFALERTAIYTYTSCSDETAKEISIEQDYYDLETCREKVSEYLASRPEMKSDYYNLSLVCEKLCEMDTSFPPNTSNTWKTGVGFFKGCS